MATDLRVPALGESVSEATVATWFKKPGDRVAVDEMLCELETDKVTVEVPSPVAGKLADYEDLGSTSMAVNLPEVAAGPKVADARIVHLHQNVPGVMARLNSVLAEHNMNIGSQTLATKGHQGYAITDVSGDGYEGLLAQLQDLDETIQVRVL